MILKRIYKELVSIRKELQAIRKNLELNVRKNEKKDNKTITSSRLKTKVKLVDGVLKRVPIDF